MEKQPLDIKWKCKSFDELLPDELYAILQLRSIVFVMEQNCVFLDMDDKDKESYHLIGYHNKVLVAYSRLLPPELSYSQPSIGRVAVIKNMRTYGLGFKLMERSMKKLYQLFGAFPIKIGAQLYLKKFYESFGFIQCSEIYIEDGIDHIQMIKQLEN